MCTGVYQALGFLTVLLMSQCHGQGSCPTGWFGPKCHQVCHCNKSQTCNLTNGACPAGDTCAWEFMGPGCQYLNIGCRMRRGTPEFIYDCDDNTCNPQTTATHVFVEPPQNYLYIPVLFRIVVNNPSILNNFTLTVDVFSPGEPCEREVRYPVSPTSVDVHCDNFFQYSGLTLTGPAVGALCSVYIIIGRNIALKQNTTQSSNSSTHPEWGLSSNAVDGNRRNIFDNMSSCSQTGVEGNARWRVTFDSPSLLLNAEVYNRDVFQVKLSNFRAFTDFSQSYAIIAQYSVYHLPFIDPHTSTYTEILIADGLVSELTLCEVEIYGEVSCKDGTWGLYCENRCKCYGFQRCNIITGECAQGCPVGKYGIVCNRQCSYHCSGECSNRQGLCECKPGHTANICIPDCPDGKYGDQCLLNCSKYCAGNKCKSVDGSCTCLYNRMGLECAECPVGKYGEVCNLTCSLGCANNVCDSTTGKCTFCTRNYSGDFCTDCLPGTYGEECTFACPLYCADKKCDKTTGICFSCAGHRTGDNCADCVKTYYGITCDKKCSAFCLNSVCNATTGICFACVEGYHGAYCNKEIEETLKPLYAVLVLAPALMLFCVCCFCCGCCICCFAKPPEEPEEEEEDDKDTAISTVISGD